MDEAQKRKVGEQVEPGGRPKAPGRLELLQRFVNTWNHEFPDSWDRIGSPAKAQAWLAAKGLIGRGDRVSARDAARLRELREAIRALALANPPGRTPGTGALEPIRREAAHTRIAVAVGRAGATELRGAGTGADGAIGTLLAILHEAQLLGTWPRMKSCRQCEYVFFDRSKNRSAAWCAMSICGNRSKNRAYRRRRRAATVPGPPRRRADVRGSAG